MAEKIYVVLGDWDEPVSDINEKQVYMGCANTSNKAEEFIKSVITEKGLELNDFDRIIPDNAIEKIVYHFESAYCLIRYYIVEDYLR